jgi:hypothetical protein
LWADRLVSEETRLRFASTANGASGEKGELSSSKCSSSKRKWPSFHFSVFSVALTNFHPIIVSHPEQVEFCTRYAPEFMSSNVGGIREIFLLHIRS